MRTMGEWYIIIGECKKARNLAEYVLANLIGYGKYHETDIKSLENLFKALEWPKHAPQ